MEVNLLLDGGGTRLKWAWAREGQPLDIQSEPWPTALKELSNAWSAMHAESIGPVGIHRLDRPWPPQASDSGISDWIEEQGGAHRLNPSEGAPFAIDYAQGQAGADRLAAAWACHHRDPGGSFIIVDAGTCITVDLLSPGRWRGGAILPGLSLQAESMAQAGLPVLSRPNTGWPRREGPEGVLGQSTREALEAGICWTTRKSVEAAAAALLQIDPCAQVMLTGGDADHFDGLGGWQTFADPNLVLHGAALLLNPTHA